MPMPMSVTLTLHSAISNKIMIVLKKIKKLINQLQSKMKSVWHKFLKKDLKFRVVSLIVLIAVITISSFLIKPLFIKHTYVMGTASNLLSGTSQLVADKIKYESESKVFSFNNGQTFNGDESIQTGASNVTVKAYKKATDGGVAVTDPINKVDFTLTPKFGVQDGQKQDNHIVYPLSSGEGWLVYTMQSTGVKEDVILQNHSGNDMTLSYKLGLGDGLEARLETNGSIGVYGNSVLSGEVTTTTDTDALTLLNARKNAKKDTLMFSIPSPTIFDINKKASSATASYSIRGDVLSVKVTGLDKATYPLSIDPSIYVVTAQQFMNGNNETNIDFDVDNKLIKKAATTGARFDEWLNTTNLTAPTWGQGVAAIGGRIYAVGGTSFYGQTYNTQGSDSFVVPSGVTSITVKMWGGGGGGGAGGTLAAGGAGGGAGYINGTIPVTPNETLNIYVGGGGGGGIRNTAGGAGGGGGYSSIYRGSTLLAVVAGGGGGGGGRATASHTGGAGGAGGGTTGLSGSNAGGTGTSTGGQPGTPTTGGAAGTGGRNVGTAGTSLTGGLGANGSNSTSGANGGAANGGLATGGAGGSVTTTTYAAGGGGGAGYFGGGGGAGSTGTTITTGGSGGGGGSSFTNAALSSVTNTAGSGVTPGNSADSYRNGAGNGGAAGPIAAAGTAGSNGLVVITYGAGGTAVSQSVSWAKFNTATGAIENADPGSGSCNGWCTTAAYNLPAARTNFSLVAYNGFLYALGGIDDAGVRQNTVYIAKLGANGEPQLWHPTSTDKSIWGYWYQDTSLSSVRSDSSAVAYNNRLYLVGGRSTSGPVNTVEIANINPTGTLGAWTASTVAPYNIYSHSVQVYNDRLYLIGGASSVGGAPISSVYFNRINNDGSLNTWVSTTNLPAGRMTNGGNMSVVWGAFIYVSGGCTAVNASGYCTNVASDTIVSSINADGSIDVWNNVGGISSTRTGFGMIAWRNRIYEVGGCSAQDGTTGSCNAGMLDTIVYGNINQDGDASTVGESVPNGTATCTGVNPSQCNLPGQTYIGNMLNSTIITNGYLYVIGGCTNNSCSTTLGNVAYVAISSTGAMNKPATCPNGSYQGGTWCVDTVNTIAGGIGAASPVVFNGRIYLVGGLDGSGNTNSIYRTTLNNDGSIGAWTYQSMTGVGAISVSYLYAYARSNPSSASVNPGNLYIIGGCSTSSAAGCTAYAQAVYKCNIQAAGAIAGCSTSGQLQIGVLPGDSATGLGIMSGTVYANYVYLIGGVSPNQVDLKTLRYAKIDNNNNIVAVSGNAWIQSPNEMQVGRRRSAAFGYNGYIYAVGGYEAATGVLADIEFIKMNVSDGSLGSATDGFHISAVEINQRWGLSVPISNSFAYVIGGCTNGSSPGGCTTRTDVVQTFQIYNNDSGAPAGFSTSANTYSTNPNRIGASSVILNGYIYVAGGCISATDCTAATNNVSYAPIDKNGNVGSWSNTTANLPANRTWGKLLTAGGSIYYVAGQGDTATDRRTEVYHATPSSGNITSWTAATNPLPAAKTKFGATVWNNRIYVVGGEGSSADCNANFVCNAVYVSPQLNNGGDITSSWTTSTSFNINRSGGSVVSYANNLYLFGGFDGTNYLSDSQFAKIDGASGAVGIWSYSASLPLQLSQADSFTANGYVYLMGGRSNTNTCDPITLVAPISANTTIASGNNPTGIGEWYETNQRFTGARYGATAAYYDGKAYVTGGACGATLTYAAPVTQQTTLLAQPQVAKYSIMIDTDSDVFPNTWLLNGVDNAIGAKWQLKYRSMTNTSTLCTSPAMTTWGAETNFGDVALGLPGIYTPKNGSGVSTNCARFYYFNVTIDSSQAFGYPDDVSRGPTITDLTLQFTADPSKRLMHGRTFTGGVQQPDDTPAYQY